MHMHSNIIIQFMAELEVEIPATKKCVERIPDKLFDYNPHERSMTF